MRAGILLWERGHYIECVSVNRHLAESLVQLRYFVNRKAELGAHLLATSSRNRVPFKTMFEAVSPGLYDAQYSHASSVAHSGMGMSVFSKWLPPDETMEYAQSLPKLRCEHDLLAAGWTANILAILCSGFLRQYPTWFDGYAGAAGGGDMEST